MPVVNPISQRPETLLRQVLDVLEELSLYYQDADDASAEADRETLMALAEEAAERGLDEDQVEKILRTIVHAAKEAGES